MKKTCDLTFEEMVQLVVDAKLNKRADETLFQFAMKKGIDLSNDWVETWHKGIEGKTFDDMKEEVNKRIEQYKTEHNMENIVNYSEE